jgi:signal transduction histidine kinase
MVSPSWRYGEGDMSARIRALDGSGSGVEPRSALLPITPTALDILLGLQVPALLLWGPSGIAAYNDACAAFIGELHPGLLGSSVLQTWPQEAEFYTRALELGLRGESLVAKNRELWLERQGHRRSVRVDLSSSPVRDVAGKPAGVLVTLSERAERATDAAWPAAAEERTRVLSEVPVALLIVEGPEHVIRFVNPAYRSIFGDRPLVGLPLRQAFPELHGSAMLELPDQVCRTGDMLRAPELAVTLDRRGDGSPEQGYLDVVWSALRDAEDRITGLMAVIIDVTEQVRQRERLEAQRRESEAARSELDRAYAELATRSAKRTVELARTNAVLGRTNTVLAAEIAQRMRAERNRTELLRQLTSAQEDEQRRIARDLHDQVGQTLTVLTLAVRALRDSGPLPPAAVASLADVQRVADDLGREVHGLAVRLRPTALDDIGLHAALGQLVGEWSARTNVHVDLQISDLDSERLPPDVETALFRIVQEALTNVARHARAQHVSVVVQRHEGDAIAIVEDDGVGWNPDRGANGRLGLVGMRERVTLAGGRLDIESAPGEGTTVIARVPLATLDQPAPEDATSRAELKRS